MSNETINLYGQTYEQIVQGVLGGRRDNFQLMSPMEDWTWSPAPPGYIDPQAYRLVGQLPKYTAVGAYEAGGNDMHQAYLQVLSLWNALGSGANAARVKQATDQVTRAQAQMLDHQQEADLAYSKYKKQLPPDVPAKTYDEFIAKNYQGIFDADTLVYNKALETLALVVGEKNPGLSNAIEAATPPKNASESKPGFVQVKTGSTNGVRPNYIFPDPQEWADRVAAQGGTSLTIHLSASHQSSSLSKSWAGGDIAGAGEIEGVYFAIKAGGGWERMDLATEDKTVEVEINIKAISVFEVGPDTSWYNSGLLSRLATEDNWNPPFTTHGGDGSDGKKAVFGEGGVLPLVVTSIIAAYQPSIDITMSDATYNKHVENYNASLGVEIGPFVIGGKGGHSEEKWTKNSDNRKFHVESKATYPYIIGITVANPGK